MGKRLGLLLMAIGLAGCAGPRAEPPAAPAPARVPTSFPPEMERLAELAATQWHACLARSFPSHVRRGLDPDSAAEAALASCVTEERSYVLVGIRAGIPAEVAQQSMQFIRHEQKQLMLSAHRQAAAATATGAARRPAPAARPVARGLTPLVPAPSTPAPRALAQ